MLLEIGNRFAGSLLGGVLAFVHPLWQLALFSFVFAYVLRVPLIGERTASFPLFLFAGLLPWLGVQEGVQRATTLVAENANLVKKLRFPSQLLVLAVVLGSFAHQSVALGVFALLQGVRGALAWSALGGWSLPATDLAKARAEAVRQALVAAGIPAGRIVVDGAGAQEPRDLLITNIPDPATIYYLLDLSLPNMLLPAQHNFDPAEVGTALDRIAADHERLWHIPVRFAGWDAEGFVEAQLTNRYVSATDDRFKRLRLRSFTAHPEQLPPYRTWNAAFADGVQLLGSYVTINGKPQVERAEPGQWLRVTLWWSASEPITREYKVFVHVVDANGQLAAQHDSMPRNNSSE